MTDNFLKLGGAPEGYDAALIVKEFEKSSSYVLHVARDDKRMAAVKDALTFFAPDIPVKIFPSWDCLPYEQRICERSRAFRNSKAVRRATTISLKSIKFVKNERSVNCSGRPPFNASILQPK